MVAAGFTGYQDIEHENPMTVLETKATMRRINVAICIWDEVELLDFSGPGEVFAAACDGHAFHVYLVGESRAPVMSQGFVRLIPEFTIDDAPPADVIVLPGGGAAHVLESPSFMAWLREGALNAAVVMSVCTGALVLAQLGLLDGLEVTTWHGAIDRLRAAAPEAVVRENRRFIDNGRVVTTAGVSAGIDGALHLVQRLIGEDAARDTARYMEYDWDPRRHELPAQASLRDCA